MVLFLPEVEAYLFELVEILYKKEYFGFKESALKYVEDLQQDIISTLPNRHRRYAPPLFDRYGKNMLYSIFPKSKATKWYVFYTIYNDNGEFVFLVRYISNNHRIGKYL